ncbi:hypothetical protein GCM10027098_15970 [Bowmanella dokdonensis]
MQAQRRANIRPRGVPVLIADTKRPAPVDQPNRRPVSKPVIPAKALANCARLREQLGAPK